MISNALQLSRSLVGIYHSEKSNVNSLVEGPFLVGGLDPLEPGSVLVSFYCCHVNNRCTNSAITSSSDVAEKPRDAS